ncbi:MAG: tellurite resistance TerB family protein [Spirulinaceae cyanobacterium SM2_1_0]|nr:tellurite resistance TerB family protein [Spirulinaceae cyanobacterium SM2_1_0]
MTLGPAEAFAALLLLIIAADGQLTAEESSHLDVTLSRMHLFHGYPRDFLPQTFTKLCTLLNEVGTESLLTAAIAALPRDLYDTTYAIALDLAYVDGSIHPAEQALLERLQTSLALPAATVTLLQEATAIRHKG